MRGDRYYHLFNHPFICGEFIKNGGPGGGDPATFVESEGVGMMKTYSSNDLSLPITSWQFIFAEMTSVLERIWVLTRYTLNSARNFQC